MTVPDLPRVLFVDDEQDLLDSVRVSLRRLFVVDTALSGREGLERLAAHSYAVVVSDMRMPGMSGAEFLARVREETPDATRVLLTGQADQDDAARAVNEGAIFRYLRKPCGKAEMVEALRASVEQHRVVTVERDLMQNTLQGCVSLLADVLGHLHPAAFSRSQRVRQIVEHLCRQLGVERSWPFEVGGLLANLGLVTVPAETVERSLAGAELQGWEQELMASHAAIGSELIGAIPRLEEVAAIIGHPADGDARAQRADAPRTWPAAVLGGELLRIAAVAERAAAECEGPAQVLARVLAAEPSFHAELVAALDGLQLDRTSTTTAMLALDQLRVGMVLEEDARTRSGGLVVPKGHRLEPTSLHRLRNFDRGVGVVQPVRVRTLVSLLSGRRAG